MTATATADREIVISRLLDAPRELVWEAWTDPKQMPLWWGPLGFTTTLIEMDVRPGGLARYTMHGPDGVDYANRVLFHEVVKPELLVYTLDGDIENDPMAFHVTVTFADQAGKTNLTMRSIFATAADRERVVKDYGATEGGNQTLARLAQHLAQR